MQKNQEEEKADLSVALRSCDLGIKTKRILIHVLGICLLAVSHITYNRKFIRGFRDIHWKMSGGKTEPLEY